MTRAPANSKMCGVNSILMLEQVQKSKRVKNFFELLTTRIWERMLMKITMLMLILSAPYVIMEVKLQGAYKLVVTRGANNVFLKRAHCTYNCFYILHLQTIFSYQANNILSVMFIHFF
jgi:hypothetical protein